LHFRDARIYLAATSAAAAVPITEARSFDLNVDGAELEEDNAFGDTWKTQLAGLLGWSVSFEANFDTAQTTIFDASTQILGPVRWYGYPAQGTAARFYSGLSWVKFSLSGSTGGVGRVQVDLTGDGALTAT
jgi:hypothetical protein